MKVLFATDCFYPQIIGSAYAVYRISRALATKGHKVMVVTPDVGGGSLQGDDNYRVTYVHSIPLPYFREIRTPIIPLPVMTKVRMFNPDIVHIHHPFVVGHGALWVARWYHIPVVITNHLLPESFLMFVPKAGIFDGATRSAILNNTWRIIVNFCNRADVVTAPTRTAVELLKLHGVKREVIPISNGIEFNKFNTDQKCDDLKQRLRLPDLPVILYAGRLSEEKRVDVLIKAMKYVLTEMEVHLLIVGDGLHRGYLEQLVAELKLDKYVTFAGFLDEHDYVRVFRLASVFVMPSQSELQCVACIEAMASGLPLVAANQYALRELIDGNGYLFEPGNPVDLAKKLVTILGDNELRTAMGRKSRIIAGAHDIDKVIEEYETVYEKLIRRYKCNQRYSLSTV